MSETLHFAEHRLQEVALVVMGVVYLVRISWLMHFKAGGDRQASTSPYGRPRLRGILYSWAIIGMPWAMESTRRQWPLYAQFVVFHLAVTAAIGLSFVIPYAPDLLAWPAVVPALQLIMGAAAAVGLWRFKRRISDPVMRRISSPDDYFSLALLIVWFVFAVLAAPNRVPEGESVLIVYFWLTAFFLLYVPFSKISHYLYYPFTRLYLGRTLGYRGVYPVRGEKRPPIGI